MFAVSIVMQQYVKHWDASSGFYYYENMKTGETQWHKPAILLGTRYVGTNISQSSEL